jgi:hypothetical protein
MKGIEELRMHERHGVDGIQGSTLAGTEVNVLNMSLRGAAIEADERLSPGSEYTLRLKASRAVWLKGIVVWSFKTWSAKEENVCSKYRAGMKFTNTFSDASSELGDFIRAHKGYFKA